MDIQEGLLYINGIDVYKTYGTYLTEEKEGDFSNYSSLMKWPKAKAQTEVSFREEDGSKLPAELTPAIEARNITLFFALVGEGAFAFLKQYDEFKRFIIKSGWLNIYFPELEETYRVVYQDCGDYKQLTYFDDGMVGARFKITFREPQPKI